MSSKSRWFSHLRDLTYAVDLYCEEKKPPGQHPPHILSIKRFAGAVTLTECADSLRDAMAKMVTDPNVIQTIRGGVILTNGRKTVPGDFFKTEKLQYIFTFQSNEATVQVDFAQMMKSLGEYSRQKGISDSRRTEVGMYLANTLAATIKSYIVSHSDILPQQVRDDICSNTKVQDIEKPYGTDFQEQAVKDILKDALGREGVKGFLEQHLGVAMANAAVSAVEKVGKNTFHEVKDSFDQALRTRSVEPIIGAIKATATSVAGNNHAQDDMAGQMQG